MSNEGKIYYTESAQETVDLGKKIGIKLKANDVICLTGMLGAGKTTLIQGIAAGLGVKDYVNSPTFIIINEHQALPAGRQGRLPLYHVDLYRLEDAAEIEDLGIEEYFNAGGVCVIEWAEKLGNLMPKNAEMIKIEIVSENERSISLSPELAKRLRGTRDINSP
ncbi:MAG: tRNA (adenosine(37)-N6)-threonylcarbamoyltransferase complex ATPase subunit type 1 TsaE [Candidatus Margulisiibacteriota bacterium]